MERHIHSVSSLTRQIKEVLEKSFPRLWVEGEISNFKKHSSGHLYFTLKDENSQIRCAMWKFKAGELLFRVEDGMKVLVEGDIQVYERSGNYQLIVQQLQPAGMGELQLAFEQLKKKLHGEGLFDPGHKKSLPIYPERVGVVTSPTGAAIRDIVSVVTRRFPACQIILYPVRVQGAGAAEEIANAVSAFNSYGNVNVLIVGRGGGSLEDLWAFNEEVVARAIYASEIPVISAVGHEIDYSISDFVADRRAPTPSAAAEMVVPDRKELQGVLDYYDEKLSEILKQKIKNARDRIEAYRKSYGFRKPEDVVFQKYQRLDEISRLLVISLHHQLQMHRQRVMNVSHQLQALSPLNVLKRGYSICYKDGEIIKDIKQVHMLEMVQVKLHRGQFLSQIQMLGESE
ncbi:MAG: exodeoxyribonuclease VII large subunit [Calditrichaeota bacterium]|nr:exodeoxyribonuclease VII large subunit [Calditrichota bacterium]RQW07454.1 MAG: exodeoxyribonuclease VII large subunit [Calditrichota bacterium]